MEETKGVSKPKKRFRFETFSSLSGKDRLLYDEDIKTLGLVKSESLKTLHRGKVDIYDKISILNNLFITNSSTFYRDWYGYSTLFSYVHDIACVKGNPDYSVGKNYPEIKALTLSVDVLVDLLITYAKSTGSKRVSLVKYKAVCKWFCLHLYRCHSNNLLGIKYSRDRSFNGKFNVGNRDISYSVIIKLIDMLESSGYVLSFIGNPLYGNSTMSMVILNPTLYELLSVPKYIPTIPLERGECVVVRDKDGKNIDISKLRGDIMNTIDYGMDVLDKYNRDMANTKVSIDGFMIPEVWFKRVHREDTQVCGRVFDDGTIQGKPKHVRSLICIDGEQTVSLDFKGLHMAILLFENGVETKGHDPYPRIGLYGVDDNLIDRFKAFYHIDKYDPERSLVKHLTLCLINADSITSAVGACYQDMKKDNLMKGTYHEYRMKYVGLPNVDLHSVAEKIISHNSFIKDKLGCGEGNRLQRVDSDIIVSCLDELSDKDIPVLPIHDALICKESDKEFVESVMIKYFTQHVGIGSEVNCKVEEE